MAIVQVEEEEGKRPFEAAATTEEKKIGDILQERQKQRAQANKCHHLRHSIAAEVSCTVPPPTTQKNRKNGIA